MKKVAQELSGEQLERAAFFAALNDVGLDWRLFSYLENPIAIAAHLKMVYPEKYDEVQTRYAELFKQMAQGDYTGAEPIISTMYETEGGGNYDMPATDRGDITAQTGWLKGRALEEAIQELGPIFAVSAPREDVFIARTWDGKYYEISWPGAHRNVMRYDDSSYPNIMKDEEGYVKEIGCPLSEEEDEEFARKIEDDVREHRKEMEWEKSRDKWRLGMSDKKKAQVGPIPTEEQMEENVDEVMEEVEDVGIEGQDEKLTGELGTAEEPRNMHSIAYLGEQLLRYMDKGYYYNAQDAFNSVTQGEAREFGPIDEATAEKLAAYLRKLGQDVEYNCSPEKKGPVKSNPTPEAKGAPEVEQKEIEAQRLLGQENMCKCPKCGYELDKVTGKPCRQEKCPECGEPLMGAWRIAQQNDSLASIDKRLATILDHVQFISDVLGKTKRGRKVTEKKAEGK